MSERMVELERVVDAPPDRVYRMWSDPDTMSGWLSYQVEGSLLPGARSVLVFPRYRFEIDVLEADPDRRFKFRWNHPGETLVKTEVTVAIRPKGWGSIITLTDGPYDTDDPEQLDAYAESIEIFAAGLAQLRASVDFSVDLRTRR